MDLACVPACRHAHVDSCLTRTARPCAHPSRKRPPFDVPTQSKLDNVKTRPETVVLCQLLEVRSQRRGRCARRRRNGYSPPVLYLYLWGLSAGWRATLCDQLPWYEGGAPGVDVAATLLLNSYSPPVLVGATSYLWGLSAGWRATLCDPFRDPVDPSVPYLWVVWSSVRHL